MISRHHLPAGGALGGPLPSGGTEHAVILDGDDLDEVPHSPDALERFRIEDVVKVDHVGSDVLDERFDRRFHANARF